MKKHIKLLNILASSVLTVATVTPFVTACSNDKSNDFPLDDKTVDAWKEDTIAQFKDLTDKGGPRFSNVGDPGDGHNMVNIKNYLKQQITNLGLKWVEQPDGPVKPGLSNYPEYEGNMYFDIPASKDGQDIKPIILQGHIDMVYDNVDKQVDKHNVKIDLVDETINGERVIHSKDYKTSIGADDGISVSLMLVLAKHRDEFKHGLIRCVLTTDEEPGLIGAEQIPASDDTVTNDYWNWFKVDPRNKNSETIMHAVNMDNETVTTQTAASMGGNNNSISLTLENDVSHNYVIPTPQSENLQFFEFNATGFQGGHSGIEYGKGKAHPYTLLMDAINTWRWSSFEYSKNFYLIDMTSPEGCVSNQIPQSGSITFAIDTTEKRIEEQDIEDLQKKEEDVLTYQYVAEKTAKLDFHEITENKPTHVLSINDSYNIFGFLTHLSNGIYIPESMPRYHSSQNCAPITFKINDDGDKASFDVSVYARSFNNKILDYLWKAILDDIARYFYSYGEEAVKYENLAYYDAWFPEEGTNMMEDIIGDAYRSIGVEPVKEIVPGGLEVSWFYHYNPGMFIGILGPELRDTHNIKETVTVDSINKLIRMLVYTLDNFYK